MTDNNWQNFFEFTVVLNQTNESFLDKNRSAFNDFDLALGKFSVPPEFRDQVTNTLLDVVKKVGRHPERLSSTKNIKIRLMVSTGEFNVELINPSWGFFLVEKNTDESFKRVIELFLYQEGE